MRQVRIAGTTACIAGFAAVAVTPAHAAVRVCQAAVTSGLVSDGVERKARARAISEWTAKARSAGTRNPSWRIADGKQLRCARVSAGRFDCVAVGRPCIIRQVPPPVKRGKEGPPAAAI